MGQSYIIGSQRHPPADPGRPIPVYLEIFLRPASRRKVGERGEALSPLAVADSLRFDGKLFDNRRRVSVVKTAVNGEMAWVLTALPEGKDVRNDRAAAAARAKWLTEELSA
jgi:hypothetical protein